jgi:hypothetical protein
LFAGNMKQQSQPQSMPLPIQHSDKSEAAHAGLPAVGSVQESMVSASPTSSSGKLLGLGRNNCALLAQAEAAIVIYKHLLTAGLFSMDATVKATPPKQQHAHPVKQQAAAQPAASASAAGPLPDHAAPKAPGQKSQKEMTKAERRALQESQRAAKAASKGAPAASSQPPTPKAAASGTVSDGGGKTAAKGPTIESKGSFKEKPK